LFYVALTRTQEQLHLHTVITETMSQFLQEINAAALLHEVIRWQEAVSAKNGSLNPANARFIAQMTRRFGQQRYFEQYASTNDVSDVALAVTSGLTGFPANKLREAGLDSADVAFWQRLAQHSD
jgi:hypothetical protein